MLFKVQLDTVLWPFISAIGEKGSYEKTWTLCILLRQQGNDVALTGFGQTAHSWADSPLSWGLGSFWSCMDVDHSFWVGLENYPPYLSTRGTTNPNTTSINYKNRSPSIFASFSRFFFGTFFCFVYRSTAVQVERSFL